MNDQDLQGVRALRADLDQPPTGALARARARALTGAPAHPDRRVRARLVPVLAVGVAVVVTAVGVVALVSPRGLSAPAPGFGPAPSAGAQLAEVIDDLVARAEAGPAAAAISGDQFVRSTQLVRDDTGWYTHDVWLIPNGLRVVRVVHHFPDGHTEEGNGGSANLPRTSPETTGPTPAWLAQLDPDPEKLYAALTTRAPVWVQLSDLAKEADVLIPPRVRAGMVRLLGITSNVAPVERTVSGHRFWAIGFVSQDADTREEVLIDPTTGRIAGTMRYVLKQIVESKDCPMDRPDDPCHTSGKGPDYVSAAHPDDPLSVTLWSTAVDNDAK